MVESLNAKVELTTPGTSYLGVGDYGQIMIGDKAFEFYNDRDTNKFVQIPWEEVDVVIASVMFGGRWIPRYALRTKKNGTYKFSSRKPKVVLRAIREHIPAERIVRSLTFLQVMRRNLKRLFHRNSASKKLK